MTMTGQNPSFSPTPTIDDPPCPTDQRQPAAMLSAQQSVSGPFYPPYSPYMGFDPTGHAESSPLTEQGTLVDYYYDLSSPWTDTSDSEALCYQPSNWELEHELRDN